MLTNNHIFDNLAVAYRVPHSVSKPTNISGQLPRAQQPLWLNNLTPSDDICMHSTTWSLTSLSEASRGVMTAA